MRRLEESLRRLRTDRIDVYFNHAVNDSRALTNPEWAEFAARAKAQGKIRFARHVRPRRAAGRVPRLRARSRPGRRRSWSPTTSARTRRSTSASPRASTSSRVQPELPRVLAKAKQKDVGVVAMKTLRGARLNDMRPYEAGGATFAQAAFRWVLSTRHVDALVVTMNGAGAGRRVPRRLGLDAPTRAATSAARALRGAQRREQCRTAAALRQRVPGRRADLRRAARAHVRRRLRRCRARAASYAALGAGAAACLTCPHQAPYACPHGVAIPELTRRAHHAIAG